MSSLDETRIASETTPGSAPADDAAGGSTEEPVNEIVKSAQEAKDGGLVSEVTAPEQLLPARKRLRWRLRRTLRRYPLR